VKAFNINVSMKNKNLDFAFYPKSSERESSDRYFVPSPFDIVAGEQKEQGLWKVNERQPW
jgi:hypothetical protein